MCKDIFKKHKKEIVITNSDKGNKTVVIYRDDYNQKMNQLLDDKKTYKTIRTDPTSKLQTMNQKLVNDLYKQQYINLSEKIKLSCSAPSAPVLYGLPKIHKPNLPLRPIAASTNVPCYGLSKYIGKILKNIISEELNIKNSFQLKDKMKEISLEEDEILVSFDVVSLFTNIPTYTAIKIIMQKWEILKEHTKIPKKDFLKILQFCLTDNNYFRYENTFYNQTFGMPMGNPLSPTIADIVLDHLLNDSIDKLLKCNTKIKFIAKYVDDIIAVVKNSETNIILKTLNEYHTKLNFTLEMENENMIPFLDVKLIRQNNRIIFNWYTKPMSSGRIINFMSTQPMKYKVNTAKNLIDKVIDISDTNFHNENIKIIREILEMNNFPNKIITDLIDNKLHQKQNKNNKNNITKSKPGNPKYFSLTFIPLLTDNLSLNQTIEIDREKTIFAHKPNSTLHTIFTNTKPPIKISEQHDVVYEIPCKGNSNETCQQIYIGTTKRALGVRLSEHEADIRKKKTATAISQHMLDHQHNADFENVKILDRERRMNTRFTLESLRIQQKMSVTMNHKEDIDDISAVYSVAIS